MSAATNSADLDCLLLELSAKLNSPLTCKSYEDLAVVTREYLLVIENSKDLRTVCTAVDAVIETHSEDDSVAVFRDCGVLAVLQRVAPKLLQMVKQALKESDGEEADVLGDVADNLEPFIAYKSKHS